MKSRIGVCFLVAYLSIAACAPTDNNDSQPEIIEIIAPARQAQETLDTLSFGEPGKEMSERNKRTIGILREMFPTLTQIAENKVTMFTSLIFQAFGPAILKGVLSGGGTGLLGGGNSKSNSGSSDLDEDSDIEETTSAAVAIKYVDKSLPTNEKMMTGNVDKQLEKDVNSDLPENNKSPAPKDPRSKKRETYYELSNLEKQKELDLFNAEEDSTKEEIQTKLRYARSFQRFKRFLRSDSNVEGDENQVGSESQNAEVRVEAPDQDKAASDNQQLDDLTLDDADSTDENRNKRFLNFGLGSSGGSGGSGGGSGNFIFDIVRRPAEAIARAAGSAFRLLAGTDSLQVGVTATHTGSADAIAEAQQLVAGSSASEPVDDGQAAAAGDDASAAKGDGLTEGVPGPITRLFIIANRGIANLIQDLILRLAQTSERIVNFKARLITSII